METGKDIEHSILDSAKIITDIRDLTTEMSQFVKGIVLMLCDKFVKDELLIKTISNLVGGNMKIIEDYAQRVADKQVDEKNEVIILKLCFSIEDIDNTADVSVDFVRKTLSK